MEYDRLIDFVRFISGRFPSPPLYDIENQCINAFLAVLEDVHYREPKLSEEEVIGRICSGKTELTVFLYRLGRQISLHSGSAETLDMLHFLLKDLCSCEIYFNTSIGKGFSIVHGEGIVIGSRNVIGEGFQIFQGCTIGHKRTDGTGRGCKIGNDVCIYTNSSVFDCTIGDRVIVGAHSIIFDDIPSDCIVYSKYEKNIVFNRNACGFR